MSSEERRAPPGNVVLAEYYFDDEISVMFVVRPGDDQPVLNLIDRSVADVRQFVVDHFQAKGDEGGEPSSTGDRIAELDEAKFNDFFAPFVEPLVGKSDGTPGLAAEGETIWFVPSDALFYVPLHAVSVGGRSVIERNPVCYSPSASIMAYCQRRARRSREHALVIGDSLGDLQHAREEATNVASLFHTTPILGATATKDRVIEEIARGRDRFDVLHFSCHGYFHESEPLQSGILLAPPDSDDPNADLLSAKEIIDLQVDAELVTLSACETGINESLPGDELMGLTRALLFAGAAAIVVSLWEVDDLSTSAFMNELYRRLLGTATNGALDKARAVQQAQNTIRHLSAAEVIAMCDARLRELGGSDPWRALRYRIDRAEMQLLANDRAAAGEAFEALERELRQEDAETEVQRQRVWSGLTQLREPAAKDARIDYQVRPFASIYYWAPFVLVGDWR